VRPEPLLLGGIVEAADEITIVLVTSCRESFQGDERVRRVVLDWLAAIGEAAVRLPEAFRETHPQISWEDVAAYREFALQSVLEIDWRLVWWTATKEVPKLSESVAAILHREFPGGDPQG
jgi:uncharacterized protein with HEPN domain